MSELSAAAVAAEEAQVAWSVALEGERLAINVAATAGQALVAAGFGASSAAYKEVREEADRLMTSTHAAWVKYQTAQLGRAGES